MDNSNQTEILKEHIAYLQKEVAFWQAYAMTQTRRLEKHITGESTPDERVYQLFNHELIRRSNN